MKTFRIVSGLVVVLGLAAVARAAELPELEMQLALESGVFAGAAPTAGGPALLLDLSRTAGRWDRVWGEAPRFNKCLAEGLVTASSVSDDAITLSISAAIGSDAWVKGGRGRYQVELKRTSPEEFTGTYTGTFRDQPVKGWAHATVAPKPTALGKPIERGEHPRLLFRQTDLPALKAKAQAPFGQAALAKMNGVIGSALKYQLTGEKKYATDIIPEIEKLIAETGVGDKMVRGRILGWRFEQIALAYDMCYDVWPAELKSKVENLVTGHQGWRAFTKMWTFQKEVAWEPTGVYPGPIRYGPALAALAIYGEKGPLPAKPGAPFAVRNPDGKLAAATDYRPGAGVPVVKFESDKLPADWLALAGVKEDAVPEPAKARPVVGEFQLLPKEGDHGYYQGQIDITTAAKRRYQTTAFFYTVIDNDQPRWVRAAYNHGGVKMLVNGQGLVEGDVVRLEKGLYPVMVVAPVGETSPWGREFCKPRFTELTEEEAQAQLKAMVLAHEAAVQAWEYDVEQHQRFGGANVDALKIYELSRRVMRLYFRESMGRGGYMGAHLVSLEGPNRYALAYRNVFGTDLSSYQEPSDFLARKIFTLAYGPTGRGVGHEMDGTTGFVQRGPYVEPTYDLAANHFAMLFPLTRDEWKPAVLWAWQRHTGWTGAADAEKALQESSRPTIGYPAEAHAAWTFVNLPLAAKAEPPAGKLPLSWRADDYGWYGFRNAYKDENDFVSQIFLRRGQPGGQNAGAFRVMGLGQQWALGGSVMRLFENVVQLPEDNINLDGPGELLYHATQPDGSGVVSIDLRDVYAAPSPSLFERHGYLRIPANKKESGISGLRSFAVDYSGKSGAPCLLVIVDKVQGAKNSVWSWPSEFGAESLGGALAPATAALVTEGKPYSAYTQAELKKMAELLRKPVAPAKAPAKKADPKKTEESTAEEAPLAGKDVLPVIAGNTFTITKGSATLRATLVVPGDVKLGIEELEQFRMGAKHSLACFSSTGVVGRGNGEFMAIITIGTSAPPAVKVTGQGLNATVTVGSRQVRFDGQKVVLE